MACRRLAPICGEGSMIIEIEINGARVRISGDNLQVTTTEITVDNVSMGAPPLTAAPDAIDIKSLRKSLNITRADLAAEFGVDISTVCRWENEGLPDRGTSRKAVEHWIASSEVTA